MKRHVLSALLIIIAYSGLSIHGESLATDRLGCLTCHQYPGLVKLEKPDTFKVLHIDEEKHLASKHGKVDCRQCHVEINQIPHTDMTNVECTTSCHAEDREKITAMRSDLSAYHKEERFAITGIDDKSSCNECHPLYPHSKNIKVRALVNMHSGFLLCEVCHLKKENQANLSYDWKKPEKVFFTGEPYGTHEMQETKSSPKKKGVISRMLKIFSSDESGSEADTKTTYTISRIAPFSVVAGKKTLIMNTHDNQKAIEFKTREKSLSPEKREKELNAFHKNIARKEVSTACNGCHSANGILDFKKLGFDSRKIKDLQYLNIKSLVTKYDVFYLPNLFGQ